MSAGSPPASDFPQTRSMWDWKQSSSLTLHHSKNCEVERSILKVINGSVLLGGIQLCRGLSGAMEGTVFTFQQIGDDLPTFSLLLLFINGCLDSDKNPVQMHGRKAHKTLQDFVVWEGG